MKVPERTLLEMQKAFEGTIFNQEEINDIRKLPKVHFSKARNLNHNFKPPSNTGSQMSLGFGAANHRSLGSIGPPTNAMTEREYLNIKATPFQTLDPHLSKSIL